MPSAACNLARLTHAPDITLIYESGTHRRPSRRAAALDRRRRTVRDRADHRVGAGDVPLLAAGRAHHRRLPRRRADRQLRQSQHHGGRPLRQAEGAAARRRRRAGDRDLLRRDLHHHGAGASAASSTSSISSPRSATARAAITASGSASTTKGPTRLITDLCVFEPDPETKEMTVVSIHPGVTREQIQENTGWPVAQVRGARASQRRRRAARPSA